MKATVPEGLAAVRLNPEGWRDWQQWIIASPFSHFFAVGFVIKFVFLLLDPSPQVFLGDSGSYLQTALTGWIPPDRSFLYGFIIRWCTSQSGSLFSLVLVQVLASTLTAALVGWLLWRFTSASKRLAGVATILCALDPIQLMYERFVMAESFSLLAAVVFMLFIFLFIASGRNRYLVVASLAGLLAVALRISFLPVVIALSFSAPIIRFLFPVADPVLPAKTRTYPLLQSLAVIAVCHFSFHTGYKLLNGWLSGSFSAYQYADGFSILSSWYPAVIPADLRAAEVPEYVLKGLAPATLDRRRSQRWSNDGIVVALTREYQDATKANAAAKRIALHILQRDPVGIAGLAVRTYFRGWEHAVIKGAIQEDTGRDYPVPKELLKSIGRHYHVSLNSNGNQRTLTKTYFSHSIQWYRLLLLSPFLLLVTTCLGGSAERSFFLVLSLNDAVLLATVCGLSVDNSIRYLHPLGWTVLVLISYWLGRLADARS